MSVESESNCYQQQMRIIRVLVRLWIWSEYIWKMWRHRRSLYCCCSGEKTCKCYSLTVELALLLLMFYFFFEATKHTSYFWGDNQAKTDWFNCPGKLDSGILERHALWQHWCVCSCREATALRVDWTSTDRYVSKTPTGSTTSLITEACRGCVHWKGKKTQKKLNKTRALIKNTT